jgi:hypothetical protein
MTTPKKKPCSGINCPQGPCKKGKPAKKVKTWRSLEVTEYLDTGNIQRAIEGALNELSEDGYEPALTTYAGAHHGVHVIVSGWKMS